MNSTYAHYEMNALIAVFFAATLLRASAADDATTTEARIDDILHQAFSKRYEANSKADRDYRSAVASAFQFADRVEVYLLDFSINKDYGYRLKDDEKGFPIRPYSREPFDEAKTKILNTSKVPAKEIPTWCAAVTKMVTSDKESGGAFCHYPIHGLRIYAGTKLLFETSICWTCNNFYFTYTSESEWVHLTEDANDLKKLLDGFMPIPEAELQRFPGYKPKPK